MLPLLRVSLAGVFVLAGVTKLLDRPGSRQSLADFGLPDALVPVAALALPITELAVALALLPASTAVYGASGAAALLLVFIAAIGVSLSRGRRPDCHCFGQLHSKPIGWPLLARNGLMLLAAAVVVVAGWPDGRGGLLDWFQRLPVAAQVVLAGVLLTVTTLSAKILARRDVAPPPIFSDFVAGALPIDSPAPEFSLPGLDGSVVTLQMLLAGQKPVVLIFTAPTCGSCIELLPDIERWQHEQVETLTLAMVTSGTVEANRAKLGGRAISRVLRQTVREVADAFGVQVTPGAVLVRADGTIGSLPALGDGAVRRLIGNVAGASAMARVLHSPAQDFTLPDLEGRQVSLSQFYARTTVLLFWDPGCTHCQQLLGHIRLWEARPPGERAHLLVVSKGGAADNASLGLRSTIVLDQGFGVGSRYGLYGTPSAVLIDGAGHIASEPAIGGAAILALIGQPDLSPASSACPQEDDSRAAPAVNATLLPGSRPLRQDCVHDELLADGSMLLYDSCRKLVLTLNPTGALVWEYCDGEHDVSAIVADVVGLFPSATTADRDIRDLLDSLLQAGLIASLPQRATESTSPVASL